MVQTKSKTYKRGSTVVKYDTTKTPGHTRMVATWSNGEKARRAQERAVAQGKREESKKQAAEARRVKNLRSSGTKPKAKRKR